MVVESICEHAWNAVVQRTCGVGCVGAMEAHPMKWRGTLWIARAIVFGGVWAGNDS